VLEMEFVRFWNWVSGQVRAAKLGCSSRCAGRGVVDFLVSIL
jgi:hypothetical protein